MDMISNLRDKLKVILSTLAYIQRDGKTLMLHRNKRDKDFHKGKYNGVGGKFEAGETPEECLIREIFEETGLKVICFNYEGLISFPDFDGENDWYTFVYTITEFSGEVVDSDEGTLHWILDDEITNLNLWDGDKYFLKWIYAPEGDKGPFSAKFFYEEGHYVKHDVKFL